MPKYIVAARRAGRTDIQVRNANAILARVRDVSRTMGAVLFSAATDGTRAIATFEGEPSDAASIQAMLPDDVIIEEVIPHELQRVAPQFIASQLQVTPKKEATPVVVTITGDGTPLWNTTVVLVLTNDKKKVQSLSATTDQNGIATFSYDPTEWSRAMLMATPAGGYWMSLLTDPDAPPAIDCAALPQGPLAWWQEIMGGDAVDPSRGKGISIGLVDTGVGPNPALDAVVNLGSIIDGVYDPCGGADVENHGSLVCGVMAATQVGAGGFVGIAPGATVYSLRVFPPNGSATQGDIAAAIDMLVDHHQVDLINLSLASALPSAIEHDAIIAAAEHGTLCVVAAGNASSPVLYPARFPECAGVSALGQKGWGPANSVAANMTPTDSDRFGDDGLFLAAFSSFGTNLTATAPGNGVISTVRLQDGTGDFPYADDSGTSMASPAACAVAAALLAADSDYRKMPRNRARTERARQVLIENCHSVGLAQQYEGNGLPEVTSD